MNRIRRASSCNTRGVSWYRVNSGRLEYRGRITRDAYATWTATRDGLEAVSRAARGSRFSFLGRSRSARRRIWRALETASRNESLASAMAMEASRYMGVLTVLAYADALPKAHVALHRLVLVPRAMSVGRAHAGVIERLAQAPALRDLDEAVRAFFLAQLVIEMDAALRKASPSPRRPVEAPDGWACVGDRPGMVWVNRVLAGPDGSGQVFMYEVPPGGLRRRERKAVEAAIEQLAASVSSLSRAQRAALVHAASLR
jgi:hypothetical protein